MFVLNYLCKLRDDTMKFVAALWLLAFVCLLVAMLGDGMLPAYISSSLAIAALFGLGVAIVTMLIVWIPLHDFILRIVHNRRITRLAAYFEEFHSCVLKNAFPPPRSAR